MLPPLQNRVSRVDVNKICDNRSIDGVFCVVRGNNSKRSIS